jgi:hypothetical protein
MDARLRGHDDEEKSATGNTVIPAKAGIQNRRPGRRAWLTVADGKAKS